MVDLTTIVNLTDCELLLLDGMCTEKVQAAVDLAKVRVSFALRHPEVEPAAVKLIVDAVEEARTKGLLIWEHRPLRRCSLCDRDGSYATYRSGPRKGQPNHSKPIPLAGIELRRSFVRIEGHVSIGACTGCMEALQPALQAALAEVPAELPPQLRAEGTFAWVKDPHRRCKHCDWTGGVSQLGLLPAVLGGRYPGKCPSCDAEQRPLGDTVFEVLDTFDLNPASEETAA